MLLFVGLSVVYKLLTQSDEVGCFHVFIQVSLMFRDCNTKAFRHFLHRFPDYLISVIVEKQQFVDGKTLILHQFVTH